MNKLWLTYAWKDNEDEDVDHVIHSLRAAGLSLSYDRAHLLAGRRLWDQIDAAIRDPAVAAWAIYVTENSLRSEPCQEELAYALDRALRERGSAFPLLGLFPGEIDRRLIPSAIATRLYVNLRHPDWVEQVTTGVIGARIERTSRPPLVFGHKLHQVANRFVLEVWPRTGSWGPALAVVPQAERSKLLSIVSGPRGFVEGMGFSAVAEATAPGYAGLVLMSPAVDAINTAQINFSELPSAVEFGMHGSRLHRVDFETRSDLVTSKLSFSHQI